MTEQDAPSDEDGAADTGLLQIPAAVVDSHGLRLWHKLDEAFRVPRACTNFALAVPGSYATPRAAAVSSLALRLLHDALNETTYLADVAGLQYDVRQRAIESLSARILCVRSTYKLIAAMPRALYLDHAIKQ